MAGSLRVSVGEAAARTASEEPAGRRFAGRPSQRSATSALGRRGGRQDWSFAYGFSHVAGKEPTHVKPITQSPSLVQLFPWVQAPGHCVPPQSTSVSP